MKLLFVILSFTLMTPFAKAELIDYLKDVGQEINENSSGTCVDLRTSELMCTEDHTLTTQGCYETKYSARCIQVDECTELGHFDGTAFCFDVETSGKEVNKDENPFLSAFSKQEHTSTAGIGFNGNGFWIGPLSVDSYGARITTPSLQPKCDTKPYISCSRSCQIDGKRACRRINPCTGNFTLFHEYC